MYVGNSLHFIMATVRIIIDTAAFPFLPFIELWLSLQNIVSTSPYKF